MTYRIEKFTEVTEPLVEFMVECGNRGLVNNSSIEMLYGYRDEKQHALFLLWFNDRIVGTFGSHSMNVFPDSYRICARMCILTDLTDYPAIRTLNQIKTNKHLTALYAIPKCIEWVKSVNPNGSMYITSHPSDVGTQRLVHNIYCPAMEKIEVLKNEGSYFYRGSEQTFWKLNTEKFYETIN
jgi:hypothetical protein